MGYEKITINLPREHQVLFEEFMKIARRERVSVSRLGIEAIKEYVEKHQKGNPQTTLFPVTVEKEVYPLQARKANVEWLVSLIRANPGKPIIFWCHRFSQEAGLTPDTVKGYIKSLRITGALVSRGGKLYAREQVQT